MSIPLSDFLYFFIDFTILLWYYFFIGGRLMAASDESIKKNISRNIVKYRELANLSQKELASKLGVSSSRVSNWEQKRLQHDQLFR